MLAECLAGFSGGPRITPQVVFREGDGLKMLWVYASYVPAEMVDGEADGDEADELCVRHAMGVVMLFCEPDPSVSVRLNAPNPIPAFSDRINRDTRQ